MAEDNKEKRVSIYKHVTERYGGLKDLRSTWEDHFHELRKLVRPNSSDFYDSKGKPTGERKTEQIFDATAIWALSQFASGLHSNLVSPAERWFNLTVEGEDFGSLPAEVLEWLEKVADTLYMEIGRTQSDFVSSSHELLLDVGTFGTGVEYLEPDTKNKGLKFRSFSLGDVFIDEGFDGFIDTVAVRQFKSARSLIAEFGEDNVPEQVIKAVSGGHPNQTFEYVHLVMPNTDFRASGLPVSTNMPIASYKFIDGLSGNDEDSRNKALLSIGGYMEMPFLTPRWNKLAGEVYGRSPAMNCLPDIKMVNHIEKVMLRASQKAVDPPLIVPDDGFILPIRTAPSSLIFKSPGVDPIEPLQTGARIEVGFEVLQQHRDLIVRCFHVDWILRDKKKERQTATEIMDDRNEMFQQMAPMLGRLQVEWLTPMLSRAYRLLSDMGKIPEPPAILANSRITPEYVAPAVKAQYASKGAGLQRFLQSLTEIGQIDPKVFIGLKSENVPDQLARYTDAPRSLVRTTEEIQQLMQQQEQQARQQQAIEAAPQAAKALKDVASARESGMNVLPGGI